MIYKNIRSTKITGSENSKSIDLSSNVFEDVGEEVALWAENRNKEIETLKAMETYRQAFGCIVGYSDHTLGDHISCAAVARGAKVIEKHYTFDKNAKGPDHQFAIEPDDLKAMIDKIREP